MLSYDSMMQRNASMHRSASFVENLSKLCQVFPNIPEEVIETVLRQHQGNLQNASEALLASEGGEGDDPSGRSELATPSDQVWQDEELARALQASLDAEAGRPAGSHWFAAVDREGAEGASSAALWPTGTGDTLQQLKEAATSVGRTLSDGVSALTETLSGWLAPFAEEEEEQQGRRTGSPREADRHDAQGTALGGGDNPLHRRTQLARSGARRSQDGADDAEDSKKDK